MAVRPEEVAGRAESEQNRLSRLAQEYLEKRGVTVVEIAAIVYDLQKSYIPELTLDACIESVYRVLDKREVQNAVFTGVALDRLAERGLLEEPLQTFISSDDGLYGIDEVLALSIVNIYGSIGFTNFGYLDKVKPGAIGLANGGASDCPWIAPVQTVADDAGGTGIAGGGETADGQTSKGEGRDVGPAGSGAGSTRSVEQGRKKAPTENGTLSENDAPERLEPPAQEGRLRRNERQVNTFLDDIISAIAAAAAARIAHQSRDGKLTC